MVLDTAQILDANIFENVFFSDEQLQTSSKYNAQAASALREERKKPVYQ